MYRQADHPCALAAALAVLVAVVCAGFAAPLLAADPVGWRTDGTGRYPQAVPPIEWAKDKNVIWVSPMPANSNATPVPVGDRLLVNAEPATLICVSAADGSVLWQRSNLYEDVLSGEELVVLKQEREQFEALQNEIKGIEEQIKHIRDDLAKTPDDAALKTKQGELEQKKAELAKQQQALSRYQPPPTHPVTGYSTPTPVSDGTQVWAVYGNGVVACYDLEGSRKWARIVEKPTHGWGHSASPVLVGDRLIVHFNTMFGLDPATGAEIWKAGVPMDWGTSIPAKVGDVEVVVAPAGFIVRVSDGKVLAQNLYRLDYCAPIINEGIVYFIQIPGANRLGGRAFQLPAQPADKLECKSLWNGRDERFYASPVFHEGLIYAVNQLDYLVVIDAANGGVVYERKLGLGGTHYPSVTLAGNHIFVSSDSGNTVIVEPGREYKEVARNSLEPFRSCPVFVGTRMYVRTEKNLYCIGQ